ncbi:MAG: hypothetical protein FWF46_00005 [Oscillospiraceae bacterium]|nr:hypothetical protein [Oscillospiraceae bacterium]
MEGIQKVSLGELIKDNNEVRGEIVKLDEYFFECSFDIYLNGRKIIVGIASAMESGELVPCLFHVTSPIVLTVEDWEILEEWIFTKILRDECSNKVAQ